MGRSQQTRFLRAVEHELRTSMLRIGHPTLRAVADHLCFGSTAKRARPRLVWHFAHCLDEPPPFEAIVDVAVASELVHSSSLLHDDVVDVGMRRRGQLSANARFGNPAAVLGGDMTLTLAIQRLSDHPRELTSSLVGCVAQMTDAAIAEIDGRWRVDLDVDDWQRIAAGKTSALFVWCGDAVATLARDERARVALIRCARHVGVAFQLADDLLDIGFGSHGLGAASEREGKGRLEDLRNGNPNFAVIAAAQHSPQIARWLEQLYAESERAETGAASSDERELQLRSLGEAVRASPTTFAALGRLDHEIALALDALAAGAERGLDATEAFDAIASWTRALTDRLHSPTLPPSERKVG